MFRFSIPLAVALTFAGLASAADLDDLPWTQAGARVDVWTPQPKWLSNASPTATVTSDGSVACFAVNEPGLGMKWSMPLPTVSLVELPWLVVRYRAENLDTSSTDYLVHLDDRVAGTQLQALRLCDARSDGQWHTAAVELAALTRAETAVAVAVQVQANAPGKGRLWIEFLSLRDQPPKDATIVQRVPAVPPAPDWAAPLQTMKWGARDEWLANPAMESRHRVEQAGANLVFRVEEPGRGMKWSAELPAAVSLEGYRYITMRYRAQRLGSHSDYAICGLGKPRSGGPDYAPMVASTEPVADGRWHTLSVEVGDAAAKLRAITGLAAQVQAAEPDASIEISEVRLANARQASPLADSVDWQRRADWIAFQAVPLATRATGRSEAWRTHLQLSDWFDRQEVTVHGIPFRLISQGPDLAVTPLRAKAPLRIPVGLQASEVYLLMMAVMTGAEEPSYGSGRLRAIGDVDRFRLRLDYADGTADECLPMNAATRRFGVATGIQVLVAPADPAKRLEAVTVCDATRQAAFGVAAVTVYTDRAGRHPEALDSAPPLRPRTPSAGVASAGAGGPMQLAGLSVQLDVALPASGPPRIERLVHRPSGWNYLTAPCPLVGLRVDGKDLPMSDLEPMPPENAAQEPRWYRVRSVDGLRLGVTAKSQGESLSLIVELHHAGKQQHRVALRAPLLKYRLSERPEDAFYLVPRRGAALDHRDGSYRERYCGSFPLQFLDTFSPSLGRGLSLRTEDTLCARKIFLLSKQASTFTLGVEYPEQTLAPGTRFQTPRMVLTATDGDWHCGLKAYRDWLAGWYRPLSPRKPWFREVFNFRQRFLWALDPLYDAQQGTLHFERAIDEARREFGGIDYLHLFDWGNCGPYGRIYGRTGDYSPYDYLRGGRDSLARAIAGVQAQNVPVGLYIEGYLLEERGKLGHQFGRSWQSIGPDGKGRYWPQSSEMVVCAGVHAWQEVQASTYAAKVQELGADGLYLDEFGFAGENQDCWSKEHGHAVPSHAVTTERDCTCAVRERVGITNILGGERGRVGRAGVALYSEESPVDVTSQYQDGSFTYAMFSAQRSSGLVPLNLTRFALPDFKTIEILYCDGPTGSWATGVKWVFFNGEAIWLEGPAAQWFEPETRDAIRRCYAILRKHRDAFTTLRPVPLVPAQQGGVYVNAFPVERKTVYTLYNARRVTVRGPVLRLPHRENVTCFDEWNQRPVRIERSGPDDLLWLELGPCDVGCVAVGS